jgi:hypothetical protein
MGTKLEKELKQAGKELRLIEEGKLIPKNADDFLKEMQVKHGGKRKGAGKKSPLQTQYPNEVKQQITLRLYPTQLRKIEGKYGSVQKALDSIL